MINQLPRHGKFHCGPNHEMQAWCKSELSYVKNENGPSFCIRSFKEVRARYAAILRGRDATTSGQEGKVGVGQLTGSLNSVSGKRVPQRVGTRGVHGELLAGNTVMCDGNGFPGCMDSFLNNQDPLEDWFLASNMHRSCAINRSVLVEWESANLLVCCSFGRRPR